MNDYCIAQKFQGSKFSQIAVFGDFVEIISRIRCTRAPRMAHVIKFSLKYFREWLKIREIKDPRKFSAISLACSELILLTRHNQESAQWSPDPFPRERVGSGHETADHQDVLPYSRNFKHRITRNIKFGVWPQPGFDFLWKVVKTKWKDELL